MTDYVKKAFYGLCKSVNSPKSLGLWLSFKDDQINLARATIDPSAYNDAASFYRDYVCVNILRKYEELNTGIDTTEVALQAFDKAEEQCRLKNEEFRSYATTGRLGQVNIAIVARVQQLIAQVWGTPSFEEMFHRCGWGPGSTASLLGDGATTEDKMSELPMSVTPTALPYLRQVQKYDRSWLGHLLRCEVDGPACLMPQYYMHTACSRLLTVPKDAKTDRTIAAEPTGNIFLQKGIGGYLRTRLRRVGINLDDQTRNQYLASKAQVSKLATLDLSAASDTISLGLCKALLPPNMFKILDDLRSPAYLKPGPERGPKQVVRFHKLSSMGNGFTFELETLIFWAAAKAIQENRSCSGPIGVYGDDIIVSQSIAEDVVSLLESFGFTINKEKSFVNGRFFESCGKHYFDGIDVTPVYQKRSVDNDLEISRFFNRVYDCSYNREYLGSERTFGMVHSNLLALLPDRLKKFSAPGWVEGDGLFHVLNWHGRTSLARGILIYYMSPKQPKVRDADGGLYAYCLRKQADQLDHPLVSKTMRLINDSRPSKGFFPKDGHGNPSVEILPWKDVSLVRVEEVARGLMVARRLSDIATAGKVTPRVKRKVTYKLSKRWVSASWGH